MTSGQVGQHEFLAEIGHGGFGAVYHARDTLRDGEVALKVIHPHLLTIEPRVLERFQDEARAVARLKHPHFVSIRWSENLVIRPLI